MDHFCLTFDFSFDWRRFLKECCPYSCKILGFWLELVSKREEHQAERRTYQEIATSCDWPSYYTSRALGWGAAARALISCITTAFAITILAV
jgi:hypothetical protein